MGSAHSLNKTRYKIAINDGRARNKQIGGLENKVERMTRTEGKANGPLCPILEFRGLCNLNWTQVSSQAPIMFNNPQSRVNYEGGASILQTLDPWVRDHHSNTLSSYSGTSAPAATMATGPHTATPAPGFIPRESSPPDTLLMILTRSTEMASNGAGFAFGQVRGGQSSGAASRRPAPPPPAAQPSNPRPPPPASAIGRPNTQRRGYAKPDSPIRLFRIHG